MGYFKRVQLERQERVVRGGIAHPYDIPRTPKLLFTEEKTPEPKEVASDVREDHTSAPFDAEPAA